MAFKQLLRGSLSDPKDPGPSRNQVRSRTTVLYLTGDGRESVGGLYRCDRYDWVRKKLRVGGARPLSAGQQVVHGNAGRVGSAQVSLHVVATYLTTPVRHCQASRRVDTPIRQW